MSDGVDHDPEHTPVDIGLRRPISDAGRLLANGGLKLIEIGRVVVEAGRRADGLAGIERAGYLAGAARQLGVTADELHVIRRILDDMSREG